MPSIAGPVIGRSIVLLAAGILLADAALQFVAPPPMVAAFEAIGLPPAFQSALPALTLLCAAALAFRATTVAGGVLTTGFLGGAIALHLRVDGYASPPQLVAAALGGSVWLGLLLSEPHLRRAFRLPGTAGVMADFGTCELLEPQTADWRRGGNARASISER